MSVTNVGTSSAAVLNFVIPGSFPPPLVAQNLGLITITGTSNEALQNLGGPAVTVTIKETQLVSLNVSVNYVSGSSISYCWAAVNGNANAGISFMGSFNGTLQNTYFFVANPGTYQWQIWYGGGPQAGDCSFEGSQIVFQSYGAGSSMQSSGTF